MDTMMQMVLGILKEIGTNEDGKNPHKIERGVLDYRGYLKGDMGMIFALGKTFQSGRLNIPVNIFYAPKRTSSTIGVSVGFNIQKPK
jgi:hypothetical protein